MLHMSNQYDVIEQKQYFRFEHNNFIKQEFLIRQFTEQHLKRRVLMKNRFCTRKLSVVYSCRQWNARYLDLSRERMATSTLVGVLQYLPLNKKQCFLTV